MINLGYTEDQVALRDAVRAFLTERCDANSIRAHERSDAGYCEQTFADLGARGWLGTGSARAFGGLGGGFLELAIVLEEFGRAAVPTPVQNGVVSCGTALLELGSEAQCRAGLPDLFAGSRRMSFCFTEASGGLEARDVSLVARPSEAGRGYLLSGTKLFVPYAASASELLVVARTRDDVDDEASLSLLRVPADAPGIALHPLVALFDDKQCEITFDGVAVGVEALVGPLHGAWPAIRRVLQRSALALCAEMIGGADAALACAVAYAAEREQFGRPIGSFQAIQHQAADMLIDCDAGRLAVCEAASRLDAGLPAEEAIAAAKAICSEVYPRVTAGAHQIHGGVGYYEDRDLQLYFRRAKVMQLALGDADHHIEQVARAMNL
jgi:alkylation response protein AidB-like acyl-CoA dehydrogenase